MSVRALIVDDEAVGRRRIARLLSERDDIQVVGECAGGRSAVDQISAMRPDLVFLDVQMPDLDGFGVLQSLETEWFPAVVFVTAYDQYALRAFEACAIDYLLKPYSPDRFTQAVDRALRWIGAADRLVFDERIVQLLRGVIRSETASAPQGPRRGHFDRFMVRRGGKAQFVRAQEVDYIESDGNYLRLHIGAASHLVRGTVGECADRLDPRQFVRIHRRYIVNMERVKEIQPWFGGDYVVLLHDGQKLRLSRSFRDRFRSRMLGD